MTVSGVLLAAGAGSRFAGPSHKLRAELNGMSLLECALRPLLEAEFDEVLVVVGEDDFTDLLGNVPVTVLPNPEWAAGQATSVAAVLEHCRRANHEAVVIGLADQPLIGVRPWQLLRLHKTTPIGAATFGGQRRPPTYLHKSAWDAFEDAGDEGARTLMAAHPELVGEVSCPGDPRDIDTLVALQSMNQQLDEDDSAVAALLGRQPQGPYEVVVRNSTGAPVVLKNHPILDDGRPMPTLYWLCGEREQAIVGRLESTGGVRRSEGELGLDVINAAHARYEAERTAILDQITPRPTHVPTGGVGGTRNGVKCLHAHYGWWLAGGDDPVGQWVADHLDEVDHPNWPAPNTQTLGST